MNLTMVIAGRDELNTAYWSEHIHMIKSIPLEPFTIEESKSLLSKMNITDEVLMNDIMKISGRLPVWMVTLAKNAPASSKDLKDMSNDAVERFLMWVEDPIQKKLALTAAIARELNLSLIHISEPTRPY